MRRDSKVDIPYLLDRTSILIHWKQFVNQLSSEMKRTFMCDRLAVLLEETTIKEEFRLVLMLLVFF